MFENARKFLKEASKEEVRKKFESYGIKFVPNTSSEKYYDTISNLESNLYYSIEDNELQYDSDSCLNILNEYKNCIDDDFADLDLGGVA